MTARSAARLLLLIAAAALVVQGSMWLARGERRPAALDLAMEREPRPSRAGAVEPDSPPTERVARADEPSASVAPAPAGAPAEPAMLVRGALVVVDEWGVEHPREEGTLELTVWGSSELTPRDAARKRLVTRVRVEEGRWQALVPSHTARGFARGELAGLPLCDLRAEELPAADATTIEVRVVGRASYPARLSVVDAATQHDIEDVAVVALEPEDPRGHPGDLAPLVSGAISPVEIPSNGVERGLYLVGAPGHSWKRVEWSHLSATTRVVELERSGALAIRVDADCPLEDCAVEVIAAGGAPCASIAARAGAPQLLDGLPPGDYRVALVPRAERVRAEVPSLAEVAATVTRDAVAEVVLRATLGEPPGGVELAGRIRMSEAWSAGGPHLVLRALGPAAKWHMESDGLLSAVEVERRGDAWSFRSGAAVADATYLLVEQRTWFLCEIQAGVAERELEIPDPLAVRVEVLDRVTLEPIAASSVAWLPPAPDDVPRPRASGPLWIEATEDPGVFRARVPAWASLDFEAQAPGYAEAIATLRPSPGSPLDLRIALDRH